MALENILSRLKKGARYTLLAAGITLLSSQIAYLGQEVINTARPSEKRQVFHAQTGIKLTGWSKNIERQPIALSNIAEIVNKEQMEKPFEMYDVRIEPKEYLKKHLLDQALQVISSGHKGYYYFIGISSNDISPSTIHHEIKHAKTIEILREHPELKSEWNQLSRGYGNVLYLNTTENILTRIKLLDKLVPKEKTQNLEQNQRLGFITDYARTNFYEDVAEIGEVAETNPLSMYVHLYGQGSHIIAKKIRLAEKYGLIPANFSKYVYLAEKFKEAQQCEHGYYWIEIDSPEFKEFWKTSQEFLKENPDSVYETEIRLNVASSLKTMGNRSENRQYYVQAIDELKKGLRASYKPFTEYSLSLRRIAELYDRINDSANSDLFRLAETQINKKFYSGDSKATYEGVNGFLKEKGAL